MSQKSSKAKLSRIVIELLSMPVTETAILLTSLVLDKSTQHLQLLPPNIVTFFFVFKNNSLC